MERNKNIIEYISLLLNLSFFLLHNIYIVFIGIILALYIINKKIINKLLGSITDNINKKKSTLKIAYSKRESIEEESIEEDLNLSLVETIEESGYIPSIHIKDDNIAV